MDNEKILNLKYIDIASCSISQVHASGKLQIKWRETNQPSIPIDAEERSSHPINCFYLLLPTFLLE